MTSPERHAALPARGDSLAVPARPLLHAVHSLAFLVLLGTGVLLFVPELRALATGGYSLLIRRVHCWMGVASVVIPLAILLRFGIASLKPAHGERSLGAMFKSAHVATTVVMTLLFAVTGVVIWPADSPYESLVDVSRALHGWLTYAAAALITLHLTTVGVTASIARMTAAGDRGGKDPLP